ncbi:uncharacterized protein LOC122628054 [Vespula pensylvanica]|uniref:uncharacterized protein LOC122628054 n=1 Tax=Vespula pensylvanica TaxID=30213 RepID=UPI001CBA5344|nr:uncharacterized protein LOC122628054 [Vespula pensylvanica]
MIDGRAWRSTCQSRRDNWIFQKNVSLASREHFLGSGRALAEFEERRARERVIIITSHARIPPLVISILNLNRIVVVVPVGVGTATATATAAGGRNMPLFERTLQKLPRWERYNVWLEYCQYQRKSDASNVRYSVMLVVDASKV